MPYANLPVLDQSGNSYPMRSTKNPDNSYVMVVEVSPVRPSLSEGFKTLPVAANGLPAAPAGANLATIQVQGGEIRFACITGVTASATVGMIAADRETLFINVSEVGVFTAAVYSGTPTLWVVWS